MFTGLDEELLHGLIKHALADRSGPRRWHITRLQMYRRLENILAEHDGPEKRCLCISHSAPFAEILGLSKVEKVLANYPKHDMRSLQFDDETFDFVISDQVLEHVEGDPIAAVGETVRILKPGGFVVHTTCFMNFIHQPPMDFWRFTPNALTHICEKTGCKPIQIEGWGNRAAWAVMQLGYRMERIPEVPGNPIFELAMRNEKRWPIVTWMVAQKSKGVD